MNISKEQLHIIDILERFPYISNILNELDRVERKDPRYWDNTYQKEESKHIILEKYFKKYLEK